MARKKAELEPAIHRVRLDSLRIFEISEAELVAWEEGAPASIFLNLAIAVLSSAISFSVTLATARIDDDRTFYVIVIFTTIGYLAGSTLGSLWLVVRYILILG